MQKLKKKTHHSYTSHTHTQKKVITQLALSCDKPVHCYYYLFNIYCTASFVVIHCFRNNVENDKFNVITIGIDENELSFALWSILSEV